MNSTDLLFTSWKINQLLIPNRIVQAPVSGLSLFGYLKPAFFNNEAAQFLLRRAEDGVGLVITGTQFIRDPIGKHWLYENKSLFPLLKNYLEDFHKTNSKIFMQLSPGFGRSFPVTGTIASVLNNKAIGSFTEAVIDKDVCFGSSSELTNSWNSEFHTHPLTPEQISEYVEAFGKTALLLKEAGIDGIELNGLHEGSLLDQFALPTSNFREDSYGGTLENRLRFLIDILKSIKNACGSSFPVSIRFSVTSKMNTSELAILPENSDSEIGRNRTEAAKIAVTLEDAGFDLLNCDNGSVDAWYWAHPPRYLGNNCNVDEAAYIKSLVSIPVICSGNIELSNAVDAIHTGKFDAAGFGRQNLVDHDWVTKLREEREFDIKPCIRCHSGCLKYAKSGNDSAFPFADEVMFPARCALNPETMQSSLYYIEPAKQPKKVVILGGGIGGMEAALVLKKRGHIPTILEKTNRLGGVFSAAAALPFNGKCRELLDWYIREIRRNEITVLYGTEVNDLCVFTDYDAIIVATGAVPRLLPIPGFRYTMRITEFLNTDNISKYDRVVFLGGGASACEAAYALVLQGKHPVIVESSSALMSQHQVSFSSSSFLRDYLKYANVPVYLCSRITAIDQGSVTVKTNNESVINIPCDLVVNASGFIPSPAGNPGKNIYRVGWCSEIGDLRSVIISAWIAAMNI